MPVPPTGHSSSIDSSSSFSSTKSSLLALPVDDVSSQSDFADPNPSSMPRGDSAAYGVAASPSHLTYRVTDNSSSGVSTTSKFKKAFGKRRRPSQDAATLLSSGDERSAPDAHSPYGPSSSAVTHSSHARPSAAKLTMHLFGARKGGQPSAADSNQPPPLPPKPSGLHPPVPSTLHMPASISTKLSANARGSRPRSSIMATSPSITAAIEFMREDDERQHATEHRGTSQSDRELEKNKEDWRKSDSTMASGHTVRPAQTADSGPGAAGKRLSAYLAMPPEAGDLDFGLDFLPGASAPMSEPEDGRQESRPVEISMVNVGKQSKRRSLSLNIHVPTRHSPASSLAPPTQSSLPLPSSSTPDPPSSALSTPNLRSTHSPTHSVSLASSPREAPTLTRTAANGIIGSGTANGTPVSKTNIRGRLAAWTAASGANQRSTSPLPAATSSPSLTSVSASSLVQPPPRRMHVSSTASQPSPELQAVAAVRELQASRTRSPSAASSSGGAGIRQAATSLTSGAGAMAFGLGKRAYEKVGRVWGSGSNSGSGSDTPSNRHQGHANGNGGGFVPQPTSNLNVSYGPSAFPAHARRTPNASSGTWSVSSMGGSRSSSDSKDPGGRETPPNGSAQGGMGKLVRPPRIGAPGGAVFGRQLWECVRETRATVANRDDRLAVRMIPALVLRCAHHLHKWGIEEEGLFRISGRTSHINRLRQEFDSGADYDIIDCSPSELDPHAVASVFKAYLREMPEPVLTRSLGPLFDAAMNAESSRVPASPTGLLPKTIGGGGPTLPSGPGVGRAIPMMRKPPSLSTFTLPTSSSLRAPSASLVETLGGLVARLPQENRDLLQTVVELMKATAAQSKETKMPLSNLLLVFCPSLSMGPTLLRVLCDAPGVWEPPPPPPIVDISRPRVDHEDVGEDSDSEESDSDSNSDLGSEEEHVVALPPRDKGKEREPPVEDSHSEVHTSAPIPPEAVETPSPGDSPVSGPTSRPRAIRRVPVPALLFEDKGLTSSPPSSTRALSPPPSTDPLPQSESMSSLNAPSRSLTPSLSSPQSAVSLTSAPGLDSAPMVPVLRARQFSSPCLSSGYLPPRSWDGPIPAPNHDKDLPAFPPQSPTQPSPSLQSPIRPAASIELNTTEYPERSSSLPATASHSAPSVVFPSVGSPKTAPATPTSLKKHALTLSLGRRSPKLPDDEDPPSPSKRPARRPSLNMLFNMKRAGSPSPRSRTPTISSPLSSPASPGRPLSVEASPTTVTNTLPPILSLPIEGSMDVGLGWDDVFGSSLEAALAPPALAPPPQPRQPALSQPSIPTRSPSPPPSPGRRPTTEYLLSSGGFFSSNGPPLAMPSATAVLEAAEMGAGTHASQGDSEPEPFPIQEDSSSGPDSPEVDSPEKEVFTPTPHLSFQLRRSSMEEEDWASAVLMAAGKPIEPVARV